MRDSVTDPRDMFLLRESRAMIRSDPGPRIPDPRADESHCTGSGDCRGDEATSGAASKQSASDTGERNTETREEKNIARKINMVVTEGSNRRRKTCFVGASPFSTIPEVGEDTKILKIFFSTNCLSGWGC